MTVIDMTRDEEALTLTAVCEFAAPVERVWQVWADPRQLERWWGPPTWPATFAAYDFEPDGRAAYYMTGPEGDRSHGWWRFVEIDAPTRLVFDDGFADEHGAHVERFGTTRATVTLAPEGSGTRMTIRSQFESADQLRTQMEMGMEEGLGQALGQIDAILAS